MSFQQITPSAIQGNFFDLIGKRWALLTAEKQDGTYNAMTVSWGGTGVLWGLDIFTCYVRPQRYTAEFIAGARSVSLCFFDSEYHDALVYCGNRSGRDLDKIASCNLHPLREAEGIYYAEASLALLGVPVYADSIKPEGMIGVDPKKFYQNDFHTMYHCAIRKVLAQGKAE